jgi:hypothetical protein
MKLAGECRELASKGYEVGWQKPLTWLARAASWLAKAMKLAGEATELAGRGHEVGVAKAMNSAGKGHELVWQRP